MIKICYHCGQPITDEKPEAVKPKGRNKTRYYHEKCIMEVIREWQGEKNITK